MLTPSLREHEAKCAKCGKCCRFPDYRSGKPVRGKPCSFLHPETLLCMVYSQRHKVHHCCPITVALSQGTPPSTCGYAPEGYSSIYGD